MSKGRDSRGRSDRPGEGRASRRALPALALLLLLLVQWGLPALAAAPPLKPLEEVEAYLQANLPRIQQDLEQYNQQRRLTLPSDGVWVIDTLFWRVERLEGDRVFLVINYDVGRKSYYPKHGEALFELRWEGKVLAFVGHGPLPRKGKRQGGWIGDTDPRKCEPNYYAPNPCLDAKRRWTEFAAFHGLALDPESAAIFQAYAENDNVTGDRLMAFARGQPDPTGESVFGLQREVGAMGLRTIQSDSETPCDLDPNGSKPCLYMLPLYRDFARKHGLELNAATGALFKAYAYGDYVKGDTLYAYAKGLTPPAYGYVASGIGRDSSIASLRSYPEGEVGACQPNPYAPRPCPDSIEAFRDFTARYELADNAASGRIFESYAEGELKVGDRLFAAAKGVALDQLLEASGVPSGGLVIEVYPGQSQRMARPVPPAPGGEPPRSQS